ncbi:methylaspartate mutase [Actinoplanes capillaceus]|uniref:Methylaspartate mutase n=1 Tax=Actinoplanes campanulatus TaxID=113559 RepID=A0ABQ3WV09_9ACTN|nr:cobalamin-dependent protein [Actinoplanes capillaceus]GID49998.1 methylaspartate mutase [Actinoplanes capillaceus]
MTARPVAGHVLLSTVSSDSHTWNLVYLQLLLEESGFVVTNLGACAPDDLLIETAARARPDVLLVSSVNGHGHLDGARLIRRVRADPRTRRLAAVIGGKLGVTGDDRPYVEPLREAGFDLVFPQGADAGELPAQLAALVARGRQQNEARVA